MSANNDKHVAELNRLRKWAKSDSHNYDPVTYAAIYSNLSAIFIRWHRFGAEESLNDLDAPSMMQLLLMADDSISLTLLPIIYMRSAVLEHYELKQLIEESGLVNLQKEWIASFKQTDSPEILKKLVDTEHDNEAKLSAMLFAARRKPTVASREWFANNEHLRDCSVPLIVNRLCAITAKERPDLSADVAAYLSANHQDLLCYKPDLLLASIVTASKRPPQETLEPFEGCYGEWTLLASALWHHEHGQSAEALHLTNSIRVLSPIFNEACLIRCQIYASQNNLEAFNMADNIDAPPLRRQALISLVNHFSIKITTQEIENALNACSITEPQTAFQLLVTMVQKKQSIPSQSTIQYLKSTFEEVSEIQNVCAELEKVSQ
jgi:hypothetical protein